MSASVAAQVLALESLNVAQLRVRWKEIFGAETKQRHRRFLIKRIAWRLQEDQLPKLTPEQEARVATYQREYEAMPPEKWFPNAGQGRKSNRAEKPRGRALSRRLPKPGSMLTRTFKGREVAVKILDKGFEFDGRVFRSLSGVAREITGTSWNGWLFFGLAKEAQR